MILRLRIETVMRLLWENVIEASIPSVPRQNIQNIKKKKKYISIKRYERSADLTARSSLSQLIATCNDEIWTTSKTWSPKKFIFKK